MIEKGKDGTYSIYPSGLDNIFIGEGNTAEEAKEDFLNSYREICETYESRGEQVPEELRDLEFEYRYDIPAFFNSFDFINVSRFARTIGVSPSLMRHYKSGDTYISDEQKKKIEDGIHTLATELSRVRM